MSQLAVTAAELRAICAQAEREYPNECCGIVMTCGDERRLLQFRNVQDEMHRLDPKRFPRTAQKAYYVGLDDHKRIEELSGLGFATAVIYHSHPDAGAYFSPMDRDQAAPMTPTSTAPARRTPLWPGVTYVVVSVMGGEAVEVAEFQWVDGVQDFEQKSKETLVLSKGKPS